MTRVKVFIASSSEGLGTAKAVRTLLLRELREQAEVSLWTREFELSAAYIESLEKACEECDFAVLVLTPDDVTISRANEKLSPRDNVIFELGLFMGRLGRERCFLVNEDGPDLKVPSDLLGVHTASFKRPGDGDLRVALDYPCVLISERILNGGIRRKLSRETLASQAAIETFCTRVQGAWWERITVEDAIAISFFLIEPDATFNSVSLVEGKSYDGEGRHITNWRSVMARVDRYENKILYHWRGWWTQADLANVPFHGFGEMEFDSPADPSQQVSRSSGKFWSVDEAHPEKTIVQPIQLRRVRGSDDVLTMREGNERAVQALVTKTLREW